MSVYQRESVFKINFQLYVPFGLGAFYQTTENIWGQITTPLLVNTHTGRLLYFAWGDSKTWFPAHLEDNRWKVLPTVIGQSPPSGFSTQLVSHQRRTNEVRKVFSFRESHLQDLFRLEENSVKFSRWTWQSNVSKLGAKCHPKIWNQFWETIL